jgi:hypothetical protein
MDKCTLFVHFRVWFGFSAVTQCVCSSRLSPKGTRGCFGDQLRLVFFESITLNCIDL